MSCASWKPDPKLTRPAHKWVFSNAYEQPFGATVHFVCANPGCKTERSLPVSAEDEAFGHISGICFDTDKAVQLTDRDGNPVGDA